MKKVLAFIILLSALTACHESLEDRAAREAKDYTAKNCPTPVVNFTRTDSIVFEKATKTYHYYCSFADKMDNIDIINKNRNRIHTELLKSIVDNTNMNPYKEAGFKFAYTCYSISKKGEVLYEDSFSAKDYNK